MLRISGFIKVLLLVLITLTGCIRNVFIEGDGKIREVVLNCFLDARKDTIIVHLTYSKPIQSTSPFEDITNATIYLFEEGDNVGEFVWIDSSVFVLPLTIHPGKKYRIETNIENKTIWAETIVPLPIDATINIANPEISMRNYLISLKDNPEIDNYYWVSATGYEGAEDSKIKNIACALLSSFEYADDFNRYISEYGEFRFEYDYFIRFTDNEIKGSPVEVLFRPECLSEPIEVFLISADYHLDKYMKSSLLLQEMDLFAEEMPVIYSPFPVYSNINGGTGIFGSLNSVSKVFTRN